MTEGLAARDGLPNEDHVRLYRRWAAGDIGLSITGNVQIDRHHLERPGNVIVDGPLSAEAKAAWKRWAAAATEHGTQGLGADQPRRPPDAGQGQPAPQGAFGGATGAARRPVRHAGAADRGRNPRPDRALGQRRGRRRAKPASTASRSMPRTAIWSASSCRRSPTGAPTPGAAALRTAPASCLKSSRPCAPPSAPDFGVGVKLNSADFQKGGFAFEDCITVAGWLKDLNRSARNFGRHL